MRSDITAYVSLGGNMGGEAALFTRALERMDAWPGVTLLAVSGLYRTQPQGDAAQPWFMNQAASFVCGPDVSPEDFLRDMLFLEKELGRSRDPGRHFGPRRIDLDLLLFGDIVKRGARLILPHPRMAERAFVLIPLRKIAPPDLVIPGRGSISTCLARLKYTLENDTIYQ